MIPSRFAAWLTINRQCNLRCVACYANSAGFDGQMDVATVDRAVNFLSELPVKNVFLIGGEPTIHPDFIDIVSQIAKQGMKPMVITNGIAFANAAYLQRAVSAGLCGVTTSVKAPNNDVYKKFAGVAAFATVTNAIKNLEHAKSATMFHKVSITVYKELFGSFEEMLVAMNSLGVEMVSFDLERPLIAVDGKIKAVGMTTPVEMADFIVQAYPSMLNRNFRFNIKIGLPLCLFPRQFITTLLERNQLVTGCQIYDGKGIIIDERGNILPCNHFCGHPLTSLSQFNGGQDYLDWRARDHACQKFYQMVGNYRTERCVACDQWKYCGGGCIVRWLHYGPNQMMPRGVIT